MESYDISNTGASDIVASMVVYVDGRPLKRDYRRFKLKDMEGPDDYASMEQVLTRRFQRYLDGDEKFSGKPDLLLIDGGVNHANVAVRVLESLGLTIPVFGMVKDDRHRTRALVAPDGREIGIQAIPAVFALIGQIQEETHRFAIEFNRQQRKGRVQGSVLDRIPGVGEKRRTQLLKHFKSVRAIREAPLEELEQVVRAGAHGGEEVPFLLSTIHSSKGLEYGRVILMDVADGILPQTVRRARSLSRRSWTPMRRSAVCSMWE